ncbi:MAG: helicase-related protein, partial [Nanoarchaeota archaeon]|nr:helicase-related protein [Nanoarchaeota archaeon]
MDLSELKPGYVITGPRWPEPVEIKKVDFVDTTYVRIIGATTLTSTHIDQLIPLAELNQISISVVKSDFSSEPWKIFLALETKRYRFASLYDPLLAMNASKVDPLPHQIEAVYGYVLKLPRIRFLIADDPGAGKPIMAGLIIKEMKLRNLVKRILIVVPGHLKDQWRRELRDRFEENFTVIDRNLLGAHYGENVWESYNQIITSMDFAKREEILPSLGSARFDLVIVDEAHKMSAYAYGDKVTKTDRYRLGEVLSKVADPHLLFLTATPHKGDPENFRLFMDLLEPGFFATSEMLQESIVNKDNPLFIRRMKEDLKDFEGRPLFMPRHVSTVGFRLSDDEKKLYNDVSRYVSEQYNRALRKDKKRGIAFALVILQRRLASSTYALLKSLERRKQRLQDIINDIQTMHVDEKMFDFEEVEDMSEEDRWKTEALWETLSLAENRKELEEEINRLGELIEQAKQVIQKETEVKITQLKKTMDDLNSKFPGTKILIFTESKDTLDYLEKKIRFWGFKVNVIHGGMSLEQRIEAERIFKNETQVMVATEAAGEGINLQFCNLMINYDLPWNPNRLEQRMGRIHRYGQTKEVFVYNLIATDTREGKVLSRLFEKLEEIKNALRSEKVFDVISEVIYGKNLSQLMLEAAASARSIDEILKELDIKVDEEYINRVKENLGESLATRYIDYTRLRDMAEKARENRLIPEYTEAFFKKAFEKAGGKFHERKDGFLAIESIPFEIRQIADEDSFKKRFGSMMRSYPKVTFDNDIGFRTSDSEFVSFGHPLFEAVLEWVDRTISPDLKRGAVFIDPEGKLDGYVIFFEGEVKDGTGAVAGKSLFAYYYELSSGNVKSISPSIIWDLAEGNSVGEIVNIEEVKKKTLSSVISGLSEYTEKLRADRLKQAEIKTKYGIKSLDRLIMDLDGELIDLNERKERGENVDLVIRNKEEQKKRYEVSKKELQELIEKEQNLTMGMPSFVGILRVLPRAKNDKWMYSDEEVERMGMEIVMKFERENGREPEDVSKENLGFDIRSRGKDGSIRYIEVKARAGIGDVALTQNEWFKAQRLANDYYLYVVWNAGRDPNARPYII